MNSLVGVITSRISVPVWLTVVALSVVLALMVVWSLVVFDAAYTCGYWDRDHEVRKVKGDVVWK
jgi:hypothetical protein